MIIVGNFKSYLIDKNTALDVVRSIGRLKTKHDIVFAPSFIHLGFVSAKNPKAILCSQDVSIFEQGAHTGEVSAETVANSSAKYTLVGHSERRRDGETNSIVATKVSQALATNLKVILCVGEEVRDVHGNYLSFVAEEILSALSGISEKEYKNILIAYEPIWAIGKSKEEAITPESLEEMILYIKKILQENMGEKAVRSIKILYGGSVSGENVAPLALPVVDGFLVGRASSSKETFKSLLEALSL